MKIKSYYDNALKSKIIFSADKNKIHGHQQI